MTEHLITMYRHRYFLIQQLEYLLPKESFAFRLQGIIGEALHYCILNWYDEGEDKFSRLLPAEILFLWIVDNNIPEPEWFADEDGQYRGDDGDVLHTSIEPAYTGEQLLAAYGLWLMTEELDEIDSILSQLQDNERTGEKELHEEVMECFLSAYQAFSYAQRLITNVELTAEEREKTTRLSFSAIGKAGAHKRHSRMRALKAWTIEKYEQEKSKWKTANQAAFELKELVIEQGKTINAHLSPTNAQRTISEWIRKSNRSSG